MEGGWEEREIGREGAVGREVDRMGGMVGGRGRYGWREIKGGRGRQGGRHSEAQ